MNNKTTKVLLAAIALGLWANVFLPLIRPTPAGAGLGDVLPSAEEMSRARAQLREIPKSWGRLVTITATPSSPPFLWFEAADGTIRFLRGGCLAPDCGYYIRK